MLTNNPAFKTYCDAQEAMMWSWGRYIEISKVEREISDRREKKRFGLEAFGFTKTNKQKISDIDDTLQAIVAGTESDYPGRVHGLLTTRKELEDSL
ncbi:MAG: hypothetical protein KJ630_19230 [Proteobacteria bacterium]|nr:hypothetical protein [Pseudomonadota bacterium]